MLTRSIHISLQMFLASSQLAWNNCDDVSYDYGDDGFGDHGDNYRDNESDDYREARVW